MSGSRYRAEIDLRNANDSHTLAIGAVPARSKVLDVGVADGSVASVLGRMGCRVWAIEIDPVAAEAARELCEDVVVGDVETLDLDSFFSERFDVVLLLDVLEHLKDPSAALRKIAAVIAPDGWIVVSLPNVTHGAVRLQLLEGHWSYTPIGLLDTTHLRFFDRAGAEALLAEAGFSVFDRARVVRRIDATEIPIDVAAQHPEVLSDLASDPDADTYQFVFLAAVAGGPAAADPPVLPVRILQDRVVHLEGIEQQASAHIRMLESHVASLEGQLRRFGVGQPDREDWLLRELAELREQSNRRRRILQEMLNELQESSQQLTVEITELRP